jgi:hypothetical protein
MMVYRKPCAGMNPAPFQVPTQRQRYLEIRKLSTKRITRLRKKNAVEDIVV